MLLDNSFKDSNMPEQLQQSMYLAIVILKSGGKPVLTNLDWTCYEAYYRICSGTELENAAYYYIKSSFLLGLHRRFDFSIEIFYFIKENKASLIKNHPDIIEDVRWIEEILSGIY